MNKHVIILAIAALATPIAVSADATVYGKLRQTIDNVDKEQVTTKEDEWQINSRGSRLGVKGSEDLGNGLKAVYKIELQLDLDGDEFASDDGAHRTRNTYAGLAGKFGTVILGTHDTPLKISTGALDYFDGTAAENDDGWTEAHSDRRAANTIAYISPSFSGLTVAGAIIPGEDSKGENDNPPAITGTEANGLTDAYSIAAMYNNAGIHISIAREFLDAETTTMAAIAEDLVEVPAGPVCAAADQPDRDPVARRDSAGQTKRGGTNEVRTASNPCCKPCRTFQQTSTGQLRAMRYHSQFPILYQVHRDSLSLDGRA